jgi:Zinc-binding
MGKGSNVQKAQAARERNQKKLGKSDEERKAASAKAAKDAAAKKCLLCLQTFMVNVKPPQLHLHITAKHPECTDFTQCFPELAGYDPKWVDFCDAIERESTSIAATVGICNPLKFLSYWISSSWLIDISSVIPKEKRQLRRPKLQSKRRRKPRKQEVPIWILYWMLDWKRERSSDEVLWHTIGILLMKDEDRCRISWLEEEPQNDNLHGIRGVDDYENVLPPTKSQLKGKF